MLSNEAKRKKEALFRDYASNVDFVLNTPLLEQRRIWEEGAMNAPLPENISIETIAEEGISAEWVRHSQAEKRKVILYLHGGGNNQGSSITHRKLVAHIVHDSKVNALTLNYSLAPEHPFPAGLLDAKNAWLWLLKQAWQPDDIILGGDSSGGGLALSLLLLLKNEHYPLPHSAFLLSPMLDYTLSGGSVTSCAEKDPMIFIEDLRQTVAYYCSDAETSNPLISPLYGDLTGLPPLLIQTGSDELLLDDSTRLAKQATEVGVDVQIEIWNGLWHVFQSSAGKIPEASRAVSRIASFIHSPSPEVL
ncbi:alpha/beta hydrolase [Citrobacter farmeri]|uniref:alpha/beta hydrolase n=2 Tax=Citrobacter farmeri TaxID=67824 RepID=UPI00189D6948|nr:alpha/beta hydrolase [Citrobacter farmeri]EHK0946686.1 alpha/beta hydrolase [Citrobacter farmeri]EKX4541979.1 alpha/beta hydrolase [Citrobacter farmeri]MDB2162928.1 alpha/beta hydrolase [Citrobacter farmeri]HBC0355548.1 alpha/beta hydrolase [Citrobacter farmeri]HBZ8833422.1 alpha/beta hydrolase [Citrobacter farmeri]